MTSQRVGILGTGLIGASIGLGLRRAGHDVRGWDPEESAVAEAARLGALEPADRIEALAWADIVVLAGPPAVIVDEVAEIETSALVTDVAGIKGPVVSAAAHVPRFVGGHPMAGREASGPAAATGSLFRGAAWVLVTDGAGSEDLEIVTSLVEDLGARPMLMTAEEHDRRVAVVSHLPQLLAAGLLHLADDEDGALDLAAGSFRDLTRVAASDPAPWTELLSGNADALATAVTSLTRALDELASSARSSPERVASTLGEARRLRRSLAPPVAAVRVALDDRPGELARVGTAFASSGVDVRDLQLRHGPHGGGGVLTISVRPGEDETLRDALRAEGLDVVG